MTRRTAETRSVFAFIRLSIPSGMKKQSSYIDKTRERLI